MQSYLYIGGYQDSLNIPTPNGAESVQLPLPTAGKETYIRASLSVDDVSVTFYRHENLTPEQVVNRLVRHYKQWAIYSPRSRR